MVVDGMAELLFLNSQSHDIGHYPLPWSALRYDPNLDGYRVAVTEAQMKDAPKYADEREWNWEDQQRARLVHEHYGVPWVM